MMHEPVFTLQLGDVVPNGLLPDGSSLFELRGRPVVLAFAPSEWDPAQAYQSELFAQLLQDFSEGATFIDTATEAWHSLDCRSELAEQLGVAEKRALLLLDEEGVLRWQMLIEPGQDLRPGQVLAALESLKHPAVVAAGDERIPGAVSRRTFVVATLATAALLLIVSSADATIETRPSNEGAPTTSLPVVLTINGHSHRLQLDPRVALLDALRENLHLTGTKKGCDHGQCGACTVHLDGQSTLSCLTLAVMAQGKAITTIEGLTKGEQLHPMQEAFVKHDAFQCGYCTPGQIMAAVALLNDKHTRSGSAVEIREAMSGNLCRCAAYPNIIAAIQEAQRS